MPITLLSVDGTGVFSSHEIHCDPCCEKHHRNGQVTYYHQVLGAVLVHPAQREVFPLAPEPIRKQDGQKKNDCERNAAKRLLSALRREHPHLKLVVVEDGSASKASPIKPLKSLHYRFILGAKSDDHTFLFDWVDTSEATQTWATTDPQGVTHSFRYHNAVPLNDIHFDLAVNFLDYNETFNTLKNQGYHFEHNVGHGDQHLTTVLMHLMMLAFLMDQIQQHGCGLFQCGVEKMGSKRRFWRKRRERFNSLLISDWETLYLSLAFKLKPQPIVIDTS